MSNGGFFNRGIFDIFREDLHSVTLDEDVQNSVPMVSNVGHQFCSI